MLLRPSPRWLVLAALATLLVSGGAVGQPPEPSWKQPARNWVSARLGPTAKRELVEHGKALHLRAAQHQRFGRNRLAALAQSIVAAETRAARRADRRSTPDLVSTWMHRFDAAQQLRPSSARVLFGFSRMIDAKVALSADLLQQLSRKLDSHELARFLDGGPRGGAAVAPRKGEEWGLIDTPERLIAAMFRHQVAGQGDSLQLRIDPSVSRWLGEALEARAAPVQFATGGAAAYGGNLAKTLRGMKVSFHSAQPISPEQARYFSRGVRVVTATSGVRGKTAARAADPGSPTKLNYIIEEPADLMLDSIAAGGRLWRARTPARASRVILSTEASYPPTFDPKLTTAQLARLGRANDLFVLVGLHYLTGYGPEELARTGALLRRQLQTMRQANPRLLVHYQYVRAKDPRKEAASFAAVAGQIDSVSLNASELGTLLKNLDGKTLIPGRGPARMPRAARGGRAGEQSPALIYQRSVALLDALGLKRVHIHGYDVDMVIRRDASVQEMEREGLAALKGRQLGVNKVAGESGQIRKKSDIWPLLPTVSSAGLAALHRFADFIAGREELSAERREQLIRNGTYRSADGIAVSITPTRQFHTNKGGLVSLGDTLDIATLLMSRPPADL